MKKATIHITEATALVSLLDLLEKEARQCDFCGCPASRHLFRAGILGGVGVQPDRRQERPASGPWVQTGAMAQLLSGRLRAH